MICRDRKIIFIHIPKTGGSSVEDMIWSHPRREVDLWMGIVAPGRNKYQTGGLQHLTSMLVRQEVGDDIFNSCYRFTLVRDPVDRLVSQYNYLNQRNDLLKRLGLGKNRNFSEYLEATQYCEHVQWKPQVDFILDDAGNAMVEIFRLEDLSKNFAPLAEKLRLAETKMLHANKSLNDTRPDDWSVISRAEITSGDIETIRRNYREDFRYLGYV